MAIIYVDSAAVGTNNGTSWANAYTSIASTTGADAGDLIRVAYTHVHLFTAGTTLNWSLGTLANPIAIVSTDPADDSYRYGANWGTSSASYYQIVLDGNICVFGMDITSGYAMNFLGTNAKKQYYKNCDFHLVNNVSEYVVQGSGSFAYATAVFELCSFSSASVINSTTSGFLIKTHAVFKDCTWNDAGTNTHLLVNSQTQFASATFQNCDVSGFDRIASVNYFGIANLLNCKIKSNAILTNASPMAKVHVFGCTDGTISLPVIGKVYADYFGSAEHSTTRFRTGGADDGEQINAYCLAMTTNANAVELYSPLEVTLGSRWAGPKTVISGATAKGIFTSKRAVPLATPANLTTDAVSTWTGTGTGTKQKIDHTLSNGDTLTVYVASGVTLQNDEFWIEVSEPDQVAGVVTVKAFLAKPSTTVYVDPKIGIA